MNIEEPIETQNNLDAWIEKLFTCKPLTEHEIKLLCTQVYIYMLYMLCLMYECMYACIHGSLYLCIYVSL